MIPERSSPPIRSQVLARITRQTSPAVMPTEGAIDVAWLCNGPPTAAGICPVGRMMRVAVVWGNVVIEKLLKPQACQMVAVELFYLVSFDCAGGSQRIADDEADVR